MVYVVVGVGGGGSSCSENGGSGDTAPPHLCLLGKGTGVEWSREGR